MDILYLSALCSEAEYNRMFEKYKTTSSHASQKFHRLICKGLIENGCNVSTCSIRVIKSSATDDLSRDDECEHSIHYHYLKRVPNYKLNRLYIVFQAVQYIHDWHKHHPEGAVICDIISGELSIARKIAKLLCKSLYTVGLVTDVPNARAGDQRTGIKGLPRRLKNRLISSYDAFIFLTEKMNTLLNPKGRPYVVVEGVVDPKAKDIENTLDNKYENKVCIMAGLLENVFGVDTLLKSFMNVKAQDARLFFYGKGSAIEEIKEAGLVDPRIRYLGEVTNQIIVEEERRATLLINPRLSGEEWTQFSFPSKNMEYMASGTPLVGCKLPCIPDEYLNYFYIIENETQEGFTTCLNTILSKEANEIHEFGLAAQKWIIENKNANVQAGKIVTMLRKR